MKTELEKIRRETEGYSASKLLADMASRFEGKIALASSMSAEDQVVTHMLHEHRLPVRIFTLDTGRLPQETYDTIEATNKKYGIQIKILFPDYHLVETIVNQKGPNLFYQSRENRKLCCNVRKVIPLRRELSSLGAWITGLRREQSLTRDVLERLEWDEGNELIKINPLADWKTEQIWDYIRSHDIPYNVLHDQGYPSIGCAPCTRAVGDAADIRAGRWWWESPIQKECGLHNGAEAAEKRR